MFHTCLFSLALTHLGCSSKAVVTSQSTTVDRLSSVIVAEEAGKRVVTIRT